MEQKCNWNMYDMRLFCIRHDYFNAGSNKAYSALLHYVKEHEPKEKTVNFAALWIVAHTAEFEDLLESGDEKIEEVIDEVAYNIWIEVVH